MFSKLSAIAAGVLLAALIVFVAGPASADRLPEGITATVVAQYISKVPGIEHVRLVRVILQPGAKFDNVEVKSEEYCELKTGTLTHVTHDTNVVDIFTVGARWAPPKGTYHTVTNTGDVPAEMWVYQLIEKTAPAGQKM